MSEAATVDAGHRDPATQGRLAVSVVIPVYNEAENIPPLFEEIQSAFDADDMAQWRPFEVIFVEDGSDDGTCDLIDDYARAYPFVRSLHLARNWGQSAALAAGFEAAIGNVVVAMDGDGQNDPADIPVLLDQIDAGYDCVSGWRRDRQDPWHKTIPSGIQTRLAKRLGPDINDFGCTLTAYRREAVDELDLWGEGHRYIPAQLYKRGYSIGEVEVNHRPRAHGDSRYGAGRLLRGFVDLVYHYFDVHYSSRPMHLLGGAGLVCMAAGGFIGALSILQKYGFGVDLAPRTPRLILTALLIIFGLQLVVFGVLAELLTRLEYRDERPWRVERVVE